MELEEAVHVLSLLAGRASGVTTPTRTRDAARVVLDHLSVQGEPEWEYRYAEVYPDGSTYTYGPKGDPGAFATIEAARAEAVEESDIIVRRRPAGPWVAVQAPEGEEVDRG